MTLNNRGWVERQKNKKRRKGLIENNINMYLMFCGMSARRKKFDEKKTFTNILFYDVKNLLLEKTL